jgi:hypothetical protein
VTGFAVDDRIRAIDHTGTTAPINGSVIQVSRFYVFVWYDPADRQRLHLPDKADMYYLDSGWRAWDGETRWRLQVVRACWRCGQDLSAPGQAHPALWRAAERGKTAWECGDLAACAGRQDDADAALGLEPLAGVWSFPVAMLEAAS